MANDSNGVAMAGFVCSLMGLISCGLLSPVGLILSMMGMGKQANKGLAIAGLVMGIIGSIWVIVAIVFGLFAAIAAAIGLSGASP